MRPHRRKTFSQHVIDEQRSRGASDPELSALLNDVQTSCKFIASAVSRGVLNGVSDFDALANEIVLRQCESGGFLCGMVSREMDDPYVVPAEYPRGRYLLVFEALEGSSHIDVNVSLGTIFSVLRAPEGVFEPAAADFLQPGTRQVAAGFALYGPASTIVLTMGSGTFGFTLDREIGSYVLTHPGMRIPEETREFAIDAANERFWEQPVRHYVDECIAGKAGVRGVDFNLRWTASLAADVYRILVRGGVFLYPRDTLDRRPEGRMRLLYEANPMALIVEQAGGAATTGRDRILDLVPSALHQHAALVLGSRLEVERVRTYHLTHDRGEDLAFETPLFRARSLFRTV